MYMYSLRYKSKASRKPEELEVAIGVVLFAEDTMKISTRLMTTLVASLPAEHKAIPIKTKLVKSHDDIEQVPATKICFMLAEFHERYHLILSCIVYPIAFFNRSTERIPVLPLKAPQIRCFP